MKSAYELAMERLNKTSPTVQLNAEQKKALADLDSRYQAKIAEREIYVRDEMAKFSASGDFEKLAEVQQQFANERKDLLAELEEKKEKLRRGKK